MKLLLPVANESFIGVGRTKKLAKASAASKALFQLYNISINAEQPENYIAKNTIQVQQEPLVLKQVLNFCFIIIFG